MEVLSRIENGIYFITINRESALNALNKNVIDLLDAAVNEISAKGTALKGVILTGAGNKSFVAGADISEFEGLDNSQGEHLSRRGQRVFQALENLTVPVVAAINGFALGGGCELAMSCHLRIAGEHAKFGQPEVSLGLIPGYGGTQRLTRYIGKTRAMEMILTGDMITSAKALEFGLVNQVCESGKEVEKAVELVEKIAKKGPQAVAHSIIAINDYYLNVDGFMNEAVLFGKLMGGSESAEGIAAFLEKRKPVFSRE
ncbi:MAG TPA: enoyl-CoA hydratase-related protein [Saprospiraceae bacterium]|nr:enoyl-CoA hydratase-related protein [Saprospiraceae bacterium]HMX88401.1 enoyl-CoA hydratase-related protein [Saprospiraceae bacterium]HMZ39043.1 enoyl-CoA hydratase-related protein [Saprospiraceae bacterium]HNA64546.1 enoyl-CoA hydratase-related protein [Saprospiraceae bacterium]HNC35811.1 enoyl-CoA hydratase-related protein [Saprospiraceae bacterium]